MSAPSLPVSPTVTVQPNVLQTTDVAAMSPAALSPQSHAPLAARELSEGRRKMAHAIYGLQCLSFLGGSGSVLGLILSYSNMDGTQGTWLRSHYEWQVATFWRSIPIGIVAMIGAFAVTHALGIADLYPRAPLLLTQLAFGGWYIGRVAKGWVRLWDREPIDPDE